MTQNAWIALCLKIGLVAGLAADLGWVAVYSHLTKKDAWRNAIGLTLIVEALLGAGLFIPTALSLFFHLSRLNSYVVAWSDVVFIGATGPAMLWRTIVFLRQPWLRKPPAAPPPAPDLAQPRSDDEGGS